MSKSILSFHLFNKSSEITNLLARMAANIRTINKSPKLSIWSIETGYNNEFTDDEYPKRILNSDSNKGLDFVLSLNQQDHNLMCGGVTKGFHILLLTPGESTILPHIPHVQSLENVLVLIKPKIKDISSGLANYKPKQRKCFHQSERRLRFHKMFTDNNCVIECLASLTKKECGCVTLGMPSKSNLNIYFIKCSENVLGFVWSHMHLGSIERG